MYTTASVLSIPKDLVFHTIQPLQVATCLRQDLGTMFNMYLKPIQDTGSQMAALESFYKDQASNYDSYRHRFLHGKQFLMQVFPLLKGRTVLDIGGATGFNLEYIKEVLPIFKQITILDLCPSLLEVAKKRITTNKWTECRTLHMDCLKLPTDTKYDIIVLSYTLTMVPDWKAILDKIYQILPDDGYLLITDFTVDDNQSVEGIFWRNLFEKDRVYPNSEHRHYLQSRFRTLLYEENFGGFPYVPPAVKARWYYGVFQRK